MNFETYNGLSLDQNLCIWTILYCYVEPFCPNTITPYLDETDTLGRLAFRIKIKPNDYWTRLRQHINNCNFKK